MNVENNSKKKSNGTKRIGLFICHCGINIASVIDIETVKKAFKDHPDVVLTEDYKYMCSEPGQELIKKKVIEEKMLTYIDALETVNDDLLKTLGSV